MVAGRMAAAAAGLARRAGPAQRAVAAGGAPSPDAGSDAERRRCSTPGRTTAACPSGTSARPSRDWLISWSRRGSPPLVTSPSPPSSAWTTCSITSRAGPSTGPRTGPRSRPVLPAGIRRARRAGAVGLALRRPSRVAEQPRRRRHGPLDDPRSSAPTRRSPGYWVPLRCAPWAGPRIWPATWFCCSTPVRPPARSCSSRAPSDIIGGNRAQLSDGDEMIHLRDIWRGQFADPGLTERVRKMGDSADLASGYDGRDRQRVALTKVPKGLPAAGLGAGQREPLRAPLRPTWGGSLTACRRRRTTPPTPRSTLFTWPGPDPPGRASGTTTGGRARGCSSSTTTPSARRITPIRCGVTRPPTSATTSSGRT